VLYSDAEIQAIDQANGGVGKTKGNIGAKCVVQAWTDDETDGQKLHFWGGGHNCYGGTEWYSLDIPSLTWQRTNDTTIAMPGYNSSGKKFNPFAYPPNEPMPIGVPLPAAGPNGAAPNPSHTYAGLAYHAEMGVFFMLMGREYDTIAPSENEAQDPRFSASSGARPLFSYDPANNAWTYWGTLAEAGYTIWSKLTYDPGSGRLVATGDKSTVVLDPYNFKYKSSNILAPESRVDHAISSPGNAAIAPDLGLYVTHTKDRFRVHQLIDNPDGSVSISTHKEYATTITAEGGLEYHPGRQVFVIWTGGRKEIGRAHV
jgi:hypothetical protein